MTPRRAGQSALVLFGMAVACTTVSALHGVVGGTLPIWAFCGQIMHIADGQLRGPVLIGLAFLVLVGLIRLAIRLGKTRHFMRLIGTAVSPSASFRLQPVVSRLYLSSCVGLLSTEVPLAFCYGLLRPRICVSTGLVNLLTERELEAVLRHEDFHRRRFDPLCRLLFEAVAGLFFFLPIAAELRDIVLTISELQADRYAVQGVSRASLAGALHKLLAHPRTVHISVPGVSAFDATQARISELLNEHGTSLYPSAYGLLTSAAALMLLCMLVL